MKPHHARPRIGGFTIIEVMVCVVVLFILAALLLPALSKPKSRHRITCVSNLKQIGLAFRMWANDHGEKFPWDVSSEGSNGGTKEFAKTGEVWRHFQAISNELNSPKVLACFNDKERTRISEFTALTNNSHLSYFIGLDANETKPQTILSGDRNLAISKKLLTGVVTLSTKTSLEWTTSIHNKNGNIALADGSASQASTYTLNPQLQAAFNSATQTTLRFAFPQ